LETSLLGLGDARMGKIGALTERPDGGHEPVECPSDSRRSLRTRVGKLSQELAATRRDWRAQLAEKTRIAKRLERLLQSLPGAVVVLDGDGAVQECNPGAKQLLGEPLQRAMWRTVVERAFAPRRDDGHEISLKSGRRVNISTCSLDDEPGQILLIKDITETRQLQEQLAQLRRLSEMGRMVAALAHQIRTPLASALLYLSGLRSARIEPTERQRILDKALDRLRHLEGLVKDMLAFARQGKFEVQEVTIGELVTAFVHGLEPQLMANNVSVELHNEVPGLRIRGNAEALQSAFQNLIDNAIQWGGRNLRLRIVLRQPAVGTVCIEFIDDGPGIAPELQRRVLKPFFTTRSGGTGLGLAVVRGIIAGHQGEVTLESNPPVPGTTVRITLPSFGPNEAAPYCSNPPSVTPALARFDAPGNQGEGLSG
jgi:two-component system sensor histidine kinase FlrB